MAGKSIPVLLVTANVGSIFEDPSVMLKLWSEEFLSTVTKLDPKFIALHCQEVGGKNYKSSMKHVEYFVRLLISSEELRLFDRVQVFLDEDYSSAENFTALGNFYFIHESLADVLIWDFTNLCFVPAKGKEIHSGNIENVTTKEKAKFPQAFFPEVFAHPKYITAKSVSIYLSFDKEIQTGELLQDIFKKGKICYIPRFRAGSSKMEMVKLNSLEDYENLPVNKWNIKQPLDDEERESVFDAGNLDLVLAPGLGFTRDGKRLGRGKGYYDGFLSKCFEELQNRPFILGLAFKEQIKQDIPTTISDVIIDQVIFADN